MHTHVHVARFSSSDILYGGRQTCLRIGASGAGKPLLFINSGFGPVDDWDDFVTTKSFACRL